MNRFRFPRESLAENHAEDSQPAFVVRHLHERPEFRGIDLDGILLTDDAQRIIQGKIAHEFEGGPPVCSLEVISEFLKVERPVFEALPLPGVPDGTSGYEHGHGDNREHGDEAKVCFHAVMVSGRRCSVRTGERYHRTNVAVKLL
jgi:hypothetical protein